MSKTPEHGYWRSLAELRRDPEYVEHASDEFAENAADSPADEIGTMSGLSRRRFLALAGASTALAAAACDQMDDRGEIVPWVDQPEGAPVGESRAYASVLLGYPGAPPVLITTREGRPIKLEGNPDHPASNGALGGYGQSATLQLYDPDRVARPRRGESDATWTDANAAIRGALEQAKSQRKEILLITSGVVSPTTRALIDDFRRAYPTTRHIAIEIDRPADIMEARAQVLGTASLPVVQWDRADVVASIDADFLGSDGSTTDQAGFASRRRPEAGPMTRLWSVEGALSITGSNADHRVRLRPSLQPKFLLGLLHEIAVERRVGTLANDSAVASALSGITLDGVVAELGLDAAAVNALADDLVAHRERGALLVGRKLPPAAHAVAAAINASLGNEGGAITAHTRAPDVSSDREISDAVGAMSAGRVGVCLALGANPAYLLAPDADFAGALANVPMLATAALVPNETASASHWVLPLAHDLESWGDTDIHEGTLTLQQPGMLPLHEARQAEDMLLAWMTPATEQPTTYHDYLRNRWQREVYPALGAASPFDRVWTAALHDGLVNIPRRMPGTPRLSAAALAEAVRTLARLESPGIDVVLAPGHAVYDGRFANNGWLQENPNPVTSQVWGNGAVIGPAFAERNGIADGDAVVVSVDGRSVTLPAVVQAGCADDTALIELGYGRRQAGRVGTDVGADAGALASIAGGLSKRLYTGGAISAAAGAEVALVRTQEHHNAHGRPLVIEGSSQQYAEHPDFVQESIHNAGELPAQANWSEPYETGNRWGMAIDLSVCTGCNGCSVACYAENNIPVVGPEQVARGREMAWIRIDTYYRDDADDPKVVHEPMMCQHCENAPCEVVCPVAATVHSPDGLNEMIYNRCVGTRYCANNCPYKVRRFNFFNWHEDLATPQELVFNPEVTIRSRGVMEKCTFCVQRIRQSQHDAKEEGRELADGDVKTACQQACPSDAIVFGDLNDEVSAVGKLAKTPRGYRVLGGLDTRPRVTYLAKIRNPHPDLADGSGNENGGGHYG